MKYSFVVPIYKDANLAESFCLEFDRVFQEYLGKADISSEVELIFVNDGSDSYGKAPSSFEMLKTLCDQFEFVKAIDLSRNFGQHIALSCGYRFAKGEYVGMLNVDMQDPPDQIPILLDFIVKNDVDIVHGLCPDRHESALNSATSYCFNWFLNRLTGYTISLQESTLRVMNRKFVNAYNQLTESSRYIPGLEKWLGFKHEYVPIKSKRRTSGTSSYTFISRLKMALDSVISFSDLPLRLAVLVGSVIVVIGFFLNALLIIQKLFFIDFRPGYTSTVSLIVFIGGIQILFIGLGSLYLGRILREVQNRPLYIVRESYKMESNNE